MERSTLHSGLRAIPLVSRESVSSPRVWVKRHSRKKRNIAWEQAELMSNGLYAQYLHDIAVRYPTLTPMELRVCSLVRAMLPNWKIAEILGISEKTIENHRRSARMKIGVEPYGELLPNLF
jgi:DNA-binding CsgD family transcriptional regulator